MLTFHSNDFARIIFIFTFLLYGSFLSFFPLPASVFYAAKLAVFIAA